MKAINKQSVDVFQFKNNNRKELDDFLDDGEECEDGPVVMVETRAGDHELQNGDWLIKVGGELECLSDETFHMVYEVVE